MSLANISIVGNISKDPVIKTINQQQVTEFSVAVNSKRKGEEQTTYFKVEIWGRLADVAFKYLRKGNQIGASGRLVIQRYTDKDGQQKLSPVIYASQFSLPPKPRSFEPAPAQAQASEDPGTADDFHYSEADEDAASHEYIAMKESEAQSDQQYTDQAEAAAEIFNAEPITAVAV